MSKHNKLRRHVHHLTGKQFLFAAEKQMLVRPSKFKQRGQTDLFSKDSRSELFVRCQPRCYI